MARVTDNTVRGAVCSLPFCGPDPINQAQSEGIVAGPFVPGTVLADNKATDSDIGVYVLGAAPGSCETHDNTVTDNHFFEPRPRAAPRPTGHTGNASERRQEFD